MHASSLPVVGKLASNDISPWIERLARIGFVAKGVLYVTIGALAVMAALGMGGKSGTDNRGAMTEIYSAPYGRFLLAALAFGLAGYALWRIVEGIRDPEHRGTSAKGIALRIGYIARGVIHLFLAGTAASLALWQRGGGSKDQAKHWSARALELPGGVYLLWAAAATLLGYGIYELYCAVKTKLDKELQLGGVSESTRRLIFGVSRFGIAARGIVFGTIGILFARAASNHNAQQTGNIKDGMQRLVQLGQWPFFAIAAGVVAYGVYQFICAKYRRITVR